MDMAIQAVWGIGILGALGATLVILKQVASILRTLRHIHELAEITGRAARGIGAHLEAAPTLGAIPGPARALAEAEHGLTAAAHALGDQLGTLAGALNPRGR